MLLKTTRLLLLASILAWASLAHPDTAAAKEFVFVKLDFLRTKPQDPVIKAQNQKLNDLFTSKFKFEGFPTIYLAEPNGIPYAQTGYNEMGPKAYAENLSKLRVEHLNQIRKLDTVPNGPAK